MLLSAWQLLENTNVFQTKEKKKLKSNNILGVTSSSMFDSGGGGQN